MKYGPSTFFPSFFVRTIIFMIVFWENQFFRQPIYIENNLNPFGRHLIFVDEKNIFSVFFRVKMTLITQFCKKKFISKFSLRARACVKFDTFRTTIVKNRKPFGRYLISVDENFFFLCFLGLKWP
jgi:hypothetical protein